MERVSVLCLLFLCSLSRAELLNNEIIEQREARPESVKVSEHPQPCLSDIHAVLREISVKLAVLQIKMDQMQTLNQVQTSEVNSLKTRVNVTENQLASMRRDSEVGQVAFSVSQGHSSHSSSAILVKNGQHIVASWEHQINGYGTSANGATLLLEAGDVVFLRLLQNTRIYDNGNHHSTFSGHLLFPM